MISSDPSCIIDILKFSQGDQFVVNVTSRYPPLMTLVPVDASYSGCVPLCRHTVDEVGDVFPGQTSGFLLLAVRADPVDLPRLHLPLAIRA